MPLYYQVPFGVSGDRAAVPEVDPGDGSVNYTNGYGPDYSLPRATNPAALTIPRTSFNELMYDITANIQQYQQHGVPEFITTSDNGGSPFPYAANAIVRYNNGTTIENYISLTGSNTSLPTVTANWTKVSNNTGFLNNAQTWSAAQTFSGGLSGALTGSATSLATPRAIYGNNFDGTAAVTGIIGAIYGGTGNGFTQFAGAASSTKTYTLPNANANILTDNAHVTVAQGGTGVGSVTAYGVICGGTTTTGALQSVSGLGTSGQVLTSNGTGLLPTWQAAPGIAIGSAVGSGTAGYVLFVDDAGNVQDIGTNQTAIQIDDNDQIVNIIAASQLAVWSDLALTTPYLMLGGGTYVVGDSTNNMTMNDGTVQFNQGGSNKFFIVGSLAGTGSSPLQTDSTGLITRLNSASNYISTSTGAVPSFVALTIPGTPTSTQSYRIDVSLNVFSITTDILAVQVSYTDEYGNAQTITMIPDSLTSGNISTTGPHIYPSIIIRANYGSTITVKTVLTTGGGSIQYSMGASIQALGY